MWIPAVFRFGLSEWFSIRFRIWEEFFFHLEAAYSANRAAGMARRRAWHEARQRFGNRQTLFKECCQVLASRGSHTPEEDPRWRVWWKAPGTPLVLALGGIAVIGVDDWRSFGAVAGAATALFSLGLAFRHWISAPNTFVGRSRPLRTVPLAYLAYTTATLSLFNSLVILLAAHLMEMAATHEFEKPGTAHACAFLVNLAALTTSGIVSRWLLRDCESRCRRCLRSLRMPWRIGSPGSVLLEPPLEESICVYGHGRLIAPLSRVSPTPDSSWETTRHPWETLVGT